MDAMEIPRFGVGRRRLLGNAALGAILASTRIESAEAASTPESGTVNVRDFGTRADGRTDDSDAINKAILFLRDHQMHVSAATFAPRLVFDAGIYAVDASINLTGLSALNAVIDGRGAVILGRCRGQPVIDALGSRFLTIRDLTIIGDKDRPPSVGMQIGRLNDGRVADDHRLNDVKFIGHYTLACLLNNASETCGFDHVFFWNDYPDSKSFCLIQDGLNYFGATSTLVPDQHSIPQADSSFNENEFINCTFQHGGGGTPVWLGDTDRHRFYRCYAAGRGETAFVIYCGPRSHTMLEIDCHCETGDLQAVFRITGHVSSATLYGFSFKDHAVFSTSAVFERQEPVENVVIQHVRIELGHFFHSNCRVLDDPSAWRVIGEVYLSEPDHWNGTENFAGTLFLGQTVYHKSIGKL